MKNDDIDDFSRKATEVHDAIKGLLDGSIQADDIKIEGIETEEEVLKKKVTFTLTMN